MTLEDAIRERMEYANGKLVWKHSDRNRKAGQLVGSPSGYLIKYWKVGLGINGKNYHVLVHRIVWFLHHGEWPQGQLDHIDGDVSNNSIENLRIATASQNSQNRGIRADNKTGVKGVTKRGRRFVAQCNRGKKNVWLGTFDTLEEAANAYRRAAEAWHGEFARS